MSKKSLDMNAMPGQQRAIDATKAAGRVAIESAQAIAQINQQATQELAGMIQKRVSELMKTQDPRSAFEYVHAEVLQDAAKEISQYHNQLLQVSKADLIHFVNDATDNAPLGSEAYVSVFKTSFNNALQNFELIRAAMADSFTNFEKSVENVSNLASPKSASKKNS